MDDNAGGFSRVPQSVVSQPAVPASTVPVTNLTGVACMVYIVGGTLTAITVGGVATGILNAYAAGEAACIMVSPDQTIAITYTVAPTWTWIGT